ncbi:hypothetical protein MLD38_030263 [Melastoma candidum]|uniref:Uncharacterized protein n=1 Tax=Melastoma candidum TaxID=119954 RepID=A0ACB9MLB3_9MYRT|nr:hypothetical protein MLD38_030263 [Melastoma candidum]
MGVSFKVSRTGRRPFPKHSSSFAALGNDEEGNSRDGDSRALSKKGSFGSKIEDCTTRAGKEDVGVSRSSLNSDPSLISAEDDVSFTLNLFPDGYSIGKPLEDVPKTLRPYGRISQNLFSAIECGRLPGDLLDALPCKFVDGSVICEVRDYRNPASEQGTNIQSVVSSPDVMKVRLQMSLEIVVKDIPSMSDSSWTYGDLMEVESRILKALQPQLCLDPAPQLDSICKDLVPSKLNVALSSVQKKRMRHVPEISVTSNNKIHGKKICINRAPERPDYKLGDLGTVQASALQQLPEMNIQGVAAGNAVSLRQKGFLPDVPLSALPLQQRYPMPAANSRGMQDRGAMPTGQDMIISYTDNSHTSASMQGKRELQEGQMSPMSNLNNKRARIAHGVPESVQQQQLGMQAENFPGSEMTLNNPLLQQPLIARGKPYPNANMQKFSQQALDGMLNAEIGGAGALGSGSHGVRYLPKEEQFDSTGRMDSTDINRNKPNVQTHDMEKDYLDPQVQLPHKFPNQPYMRHGFPQAVWNNVNNQHMEHNLKREEPISRRKSAQSPRVSGGALPQSPLSSKSGEFSSGSVGQHYNVVAAPSGPTGVMQKEKGVINSVPPVAGAASMTSSANDSTQRANQAQTAASKRRQNSLSRTHAISGVGSPASVSTMNLPLNANSPSIGTPPLADLSILDRFSKIEMVTMRRQLNRKKKAVDHPVKKPGTFTADNLMLCLHNTSNNDVFKDDSSEMPLSKSIIGGSMNIYKIRVMNLTHQDPLGTIVSYTTRPRTRMIMSEKPNDGTVAVHYGDLDDGDILASEEYFPTLPNSHMADLLAAQFKSLMSKEGCPVDDHVQLKPTRTNLPASTLQNPPMMPNNNPAVDVPQNNEGVLSQQTGDMSNLGNIGNASMNIQRMLPPGSTQAMQMAQPSLAQQALPQQGIASNQNPLNHPQLRSHMMLAKNAVSQLNAAGQTTGMQLPNQMLTNKASPLHLQMLQQQPQPQPQQQQSPQQQQAQIQQRKIMGIEPGVGMGNISNNLVGLGNLGNAMGMGAGRGMGGPGISAPMGQISGMGNIGQNAINTSQASGLSNSIARIQAGQLTPIALSKIRMMQSRGLFGPQSGVGGISGIRSIHPGSTGLSMLGPGLNRANMNLMQRAAAVGSMGPPRLMTPGMNGYMNQQQQQMQLQMQMPQLQQQVQMPQQQQLQQVQMPQQQQQMQMQQQPQESSSSPLQAVISPPQQVGSPETMTMSQFNTSQLQPQQQQQQQSSPQQQMSQRTPMSPPQQMSSSGAVHAMSAGNQEGCPPASPQLSSQTLGSVGSITNSPMEMQGSASKGNHGGSTTQ